MCAVAPFAFAIDVVTAAPDAGANPVTPSPPCAAVRPSSCFTVTVNVWLVPTSFVLSGVIVMFASTYCFVAGPDPPGPAVIFAAAGSVSRATETLLNTPAVAHADEALAVTPPAGAGL